jgi:hypothetical protein
VDQGYRGHGSDGPEQVHVDRRRRGNIQRRLWRLAQVPQLEKQLR